VTLFSTSLFVTNQSRNYCGLIFWKGIKLEIHDRIVRNERKCRGSVGREGRVKPRCQRLCSVCGQWRWRCREQCHCLTPRGIKENGGAESRKARKTMVADGYCAYKSRVRKSRPTSTSGALPHSRNRHPGVTFSTIELYLNYIFTFVWS